MFEEAAQRIGCVGGLCFARHAAAGAAKRYGHTEIHSLITAQPHVVSRPYRLTLKVVWEGIKGDHELALGNTSRPPGRN